MSCTSRMYRVFESTVMVFALMAIVRLLPTQAQSDAQEDAALTKNAEAFVEAFHKGDANAVAAFWTVDGDYVDQTGRHLKGRQAIEEAFRRFFTENKGLKLRIDIASLRLLTPDTAMEDGSTEVIPPDGAPPSRTSYTNVHIKKDGQWYLASVRLCRNYLVF